MIIACPACSTRHAVPDTARWAARGERCACAKCRHSWNREGPIARAGRTRAAASAHGSRQRTARSSGQPRCDRPAGPRSQGRHIRSRTDRRRRRPTRAAGGRRRNLPLLRRPSARSASPRRPMPACSSWLGAEPRQPGTSQFDAAPPSSAADATPRGGCGPGRRRRSFLLTAGVIAARHRTGACPDWGAGPAPDLRRGEERAAA